MTTEEAILACLAEPWSDIEPRQPSGELHEVGLRFEAYRDLLDEWIDRLRASSP